MISSVSSSSSSASSAEAAATSDHWRVLFIVVVGDGYSNARVHIVCVAETEWRYWLRVWTHCWIVDAAVRIRIRRVLHPSGTKASSGATFVSRTSTCCSADIVFIVVITDDDDDDDDDEIAYFTVRWKTRELVLSTAPKTWDNHRQRNRHHVWLVSFRRRKGAQNVIYVLGWPSDYVEKKLSYCRDSARWGCRNPQPKSKI